MTPETYEERIAREKVEGRERTKNLFRFAYSIATQLGDGWQVSEQDEDPDNFQHSHPTFVRASDGASFYLSFEWNKKDRLRVGANWPKDATGKEVRPYFSQHSEFGASSPSMSFASGKTAEVVAKDISRRFLTAFLPLWAKQATDVSHQNEYRARRQNIAERVAAIVGGTVRGPRDRHDSTEHTVNVPYSNGNRITGVEFGGDDTEIKVTLRCTIEQLAAIVKLIPLKGEDR